jgi:hypothetical protein
MSIDTDLDRLYQVKPSEFIAERNAIATRAGAREADIRALPKPTAAVWAVNQLYWREPELYRSLIQSAENLRATHTAVIAGRRGDLRSAGKAHEEALEAALKATLEIASEDGRPPSDATRQAIATTLRLLPADDPPGRLRHALAPGGFGVISGLPAAGRVVSAPPRKEKAVAGTAATKEDKAAQARAKKQAEAIAKAVAAAEQAARREEFEAARTAREAEKAERRVARAREAVEAAAAELKEAEDEAEQARKKRDAAKARSEAADHSLADARSRVE